MHRGCFMKVMIVCLFMLSANVFSADYSVARAMFTSEVIEREPVDELVEVHNQIGRINFFSELRNFENKKVTHRWFYQDRLMAEVSFHPKGPRWRVHSYKTLLPHWLGKWRVDILVDEETLIESHSFILVVSDVEEPVVLLENNEIVSEEGDGELLVIESDVLMSETAEF
jgi:hypothetical protein